MDEDYRGRTGLSGAAGLLFCKPSLFIECDNFVTEGLPSRWQAKALVAWRGEPGAIFIDL